MKARKCYSQGILLLFAISAVNIISLHGIDALRSDHKELTEILRKCADYCEQLSHSKISFSCREKITEELFDYRFVRDMTQSLHQQDRIKKIKNEKNTYVYDYRFHLEENRIDTKRTLIEENGSAKFEEGAELKTQHLKGKHFLLESVGLLNKQAQQSFDYQINDRKKINGEKTIIIKAVPKWDQEDSSFLAKIWIRESDGAPLKIEWDQKELGYFLEIEKIERKFPDSHNLSFILELAIEKNGIRFPSKYSIKEVYRSASAKKSFPHSFITVIYENYKF